MSIEPAPAAPLGDLVAAHFQRLEIAMLSRVLTTTLAGALPPAMVRVERRRSFIQWITRQPGVVIGVAISAGDKTLRFRSPAVGVTEASVSHTVRGVALATTPISVADWIAQLGALLNTATSSDEATRAALQRALLTEQPKSGPPHSDAAELAGSGHDAVSGDTREGGHDTPPGEDRTDGLT